ncbi:D-amino-acid transaminase [Paenibacillus cremeus]|nr:D-amino-acid transaminase [Paenibacillus cremeus]
MTQIYLYQNEFVAKEALHISPEDRGYYFGDGLYEVIRVYNGKLYEAGPHFARLTRTAEALRIPLPFTEDELSAQLEKLIQVNELHEGSVYMQITRGAAPRSHPFPASAEPILMAYTTSYQRPVATLEEGITAVTTDDIRWLRCDLKTLNLLPNVMAKQHAMDQGAGDVIFHRSGTVTESSSSNVMIVKNNVIKTHPANNLILHGITRLVVLRLAKQEGIQLEEAAFTVDELLNADEVFITSTTAEVTPVIQIDGKAIGSGKPGPLTRQLQTAFEATIPSK